MYPQSRMPAPLLLAMRLTFHALALVVLMSSVAVAADGQRGFFDVYGGVLYLFESDVPRSTFADDQATVGGRVGVWLSDNWGVAFRAWYFQTDANVLSRGSPSDLAFLGLSIEVVGRWSIQDRWAMYSSLGPAMAISTLDRPIQGRGEEDSRSISPGVSGAVGIEARLLRQLSAFAETQGSLVYPSFRYSDQRVSPRLLNVYGLVGLRIPF